MLASGSAVLATAMLALLGRAEAYAAMHRGMQSMSPRRTALLRCSVAADRETDVASRIRSEPCVVFSTTTCPYCAATKELLQEIGTTFEVVELDEQPSEWRREVATITGRTSVPAVFVGGTYVGGANDGGLGGVLTLHRRGELTPLLVEAGALSDGPNGLDSIKLAFSKLFPGGSGKEIYFGVLQRAVDPAEIPSDAERARRREEAASALTNIGAEERERRLKASYAFGALTAIVAAGMLSLHVPPVTRLAIAPPLFLTYGYYASYQSGL